jgi:hypothetical protein
MCGVSEMSLVTRATNSQKEHALVIRYKLNYSTAQREPNRSTATTCRIVQSSTMQQSTDEVSKHSSLYKS